MTQQKPNNTIDFRVIITAMLCLTILEITALFNGINGTLYSLVIMIIGGLAGFLIKSPLQK